MEGQQIRIVCKEAGCGWWVVDKSFAEARIAMSEHWMDAHGDHSRIWPNRLDLTAYDERFLKGLRISTD